MTVALIAPQINLLLVDDNFSGLNFISELEVSYQVMKAIGPDQALQYVKKLKASGMLLDLLILDVKMPPGDCYSYLLSSDLTGIVLFEALIQIFPLVKCLVFTNRDVEDVEPYFQAHANVRILKKNSLSPEEELTEIRWVLESPAWLENARDRAKEFKLLVENWDGYGAPRINPENIEVALELLQRLCDQSRLPAQLVPTANGSVQFEYHINMCDLEVNILSQIEANVFFEGPEGIEEFSGDLSDDFVDRIATILKRMERPA